MSDTKMFRSQIGGFNRDDVNNFIKETDLRHSAEIEALKEQIAELTKKADEIDAVKAEKAELEAEIAAIDGEKNNLSVKLSAAEKAAVIKADELAAKEKELADALKSMAFCKSESEAQIKVIAAKKDEIEALGRQHSEFAAQAEERLNEEKGKIAALEAEKAALIAEKEALAQKFAELDNALEEAKKFNENADDKNSPAYKVGMYDKISSQLGDILISANRNADDLMTSAKEETDRLRAEVEAECEQKRAECDTFIKQTKAETEAEAAYIRERLSQTANELLNAVSSDLHGSIEHCIHEINNSFTDMQYEFKTLLSKIASRSNEMNERVDYYQSCISENIEEKLTAMDEKYGITHTGDGDENNA